MRRVIATLLTTVLVAVGLAVPAAASGSGGLFPGSPTCAQGGQCRPAVEWRDEAYGPFNRTTGTGWDESIPRRTLFSVYAQAGEQILLGSSEVRYGLGAVVTGQVGDLLAVTGTRAGSVVALAALLLLGGAALVRLRGVRQRGVDRGSAHRA